MSEAGPRRLATRRSVPGFTPGPPLVIVSSYDPDGIARALRIRGPRRQACPLDRQHRISWARSPSPCSSTATGRCWAGSGPSCAAARPPAPMRRFVEKVAPSEPFQPLRDHRGDEAAEAFILDQLPGPRRRHHRPAHRAFRRAGSRRSPARWTSSSTAPGLVSFNPSLEVGLNDQHLRGEERRGALPAPGRPAGARVHRLRGGQPAAGWCSRTRRSSATSPARASWTGATSRWSRSSTDADSLVAAAARPGRGQGPHLRVPHRGRWSGWRRRAATAGTRRRCAWRWVASASCGSPAS